jgi:acyl carrier protein phosphodiesterase
MNFLGHLYFSGNNHELMYANLFGDSVKGTQFHFYPEMIQRGILLHRKIDNFIDHHPAVVELKRALFEELPKVSAVAVDLFFDHLLARNWKNFNATPYPEFLEHFYSYSPLLWEIYPESFKIFIGLLREKKWINHYPHPEGLIRLCHGVSSRISFPNLLHRAPDAFMKHEKMISESFESYMLDAEAYFSDFT